MSALGEGRVIEDLQTLVGSRARGRARAAVRIEDIAALVELSPKLRAAKSEGESVSVSEFNALVADLQGMHETLRAVAEALAQRLRG